MRYQCVTFGILIMSTTVSLACWFVVPDYTKPNSQIIKSFSIRTGSEIAGYILRDQHFVPVINAYNLQFLMIF